MAKTSVSDVVTKIYILQDPNGDIRYVGKTSRTLRHRLIENFKDIRKGIITYKMHWFASCLKKGYMPCGRVIETVRGDGNKQERYWIAKYKNEGARLTNSTDGGEGILNPSAETRRKLSIAGKWKHPKLSLETRKRISISKKGHSQLTDQTKLKMSITRKILHSKPEYRKARSDQMKEIWRQRKLLNNKGVNI